MKKRIGVLFACFLPCATAGEIYKWVDSQGQTHFGQHPPVQNAEEIVMPESETVPAAASPNEQQRLEKMKKWVDARQQEREKAKQETAEREKKMAARNRQCNHWRRQLQDMEAGGITWYRLDDAGNREYYSDDDVAVRKQHLRRTIAENCDS